MSEYMRRKMPNSFTQPKAKPNQYSAKQTREAQLRELEYNLRPRAQNQTVQKKEDEETKTETGEYQTQLQVKMEDNRRLSQFETLGELKEKKAPTDYETYKYKTHKTSDKAKLFSLTEKDGKATVENLHEKENNYAIESEIIPKGLKVSILETDQSYSTASKKSKEVAKVKIIDDSNTGWNGRIVWTTRTNVSADAGEDGFFKITAGDANVRADATEVNGKQKQVPEDTEVIASEYKKVGWNYYLKVSDKNTNEEYGWLEVDGFKDNLANVSFGVTEAKYDSEDEDHSTINQDATKTYEEDGYDYTKYVKKNDQCVLIPLNSKVKIFETDGKYVQVKGTDGEIIGWTSKGNLANQASDEGYYEVTDDDARLRIKQRKYKAKSTKLSVGTYLIEKELSTETSPEGAYTKIALTEEKDGVYSEKANSEAWVETDHLTSKWADVKGKHATWKDMKYTGQIDLVNIMGTGNEMEYMKADTDNPENDMYSKYKDMADAAESDGVTIGLVDGFRTFAEQKYLDDHEKEPGFNPAATPGNSKHQIGIAVDLNNKDNQGDNNVNRWLMKNSYKYGFVRIYKMGKSEGHHWEYRPDEIRLPEEVTVDEKKYIQYYFATWAPDKKWDNNATDKWYATYFEEAK
ncbi:MAG: hypothetical protein C0599_17265 [Salinivirgaceae bacterium]|nr:MAG: hypothetical protein C0599_17265 [Salinivirgaceae bacterium]